LIRSLDKAPFDELKAGGMVSLSNHWRGSHAIGVTAN
jgi:hypothetical protein